ncbi:MAG TPA: polymer-forming cytoskeletal protein [Xanthobacteraceae bacterium]
MLGNLVSRVFDQNHDVPAARVPAPPPRPTMDRPVARLEYVGKPETVLRSEPAVKPETVSSIGTGMSMAGNIVCDGPMQIHGRVEGEVRATELLIGDNAEVDGNIVAQDLTVRGRVRGTIRAVRVKLQGNATVEGDIFHRALAIEENALFEGSSRRVDNPMEAATPAAPPSVTAPSRAQLKGKQNLEVLGQTTIGS